jgi:DNA processing protein
MAAASVDPELHSDETATPLSSLPSEAAQLLVLQALGPAPVSVDELSRATGLAIRALRGVLIELALAGRIEHQGAQLVTLKSGF